MSNNTGIIIFMMSLAFSGTVLFFTVGKDIRRDMLEKTIRKEALKGNKNALRLMQRSSIFRWNDKETIMEAMRGNENAFEILGIEKE